MITETTKKQTLPELTKAIADTLMVFQPDLMDVADTSAKATEHRYMAFGIMEKAGYTHMEIADFFKINRETVTKALSKLKVWLANYKDMAGTYNRLVALALKPL